MAYIKLLRPSNLCLTIAVLILAQGTDLGCAGLIPHTPDVPMQPRQKHSSLCGFEGNPDIYGLGIRIGVYLQSISGFLADCFSVDTVLGMLVINKRFLLKIFTALAIILTKEAPRLIEVAVLL